MIRLGMMVRETAQHTIAESVDLAQPLHLDAVDVHLSGISRDPDELLALKLQCLRGGLDIGYIGGGSFVGPPEEAAQRRIQGHADVDTAASWAPNSCVFSPAIDGRTQWSNSKHCGSR